MNSCIPEEKLQDLLDGRLDTVQAFPIWEHLGQCDVCRRSYQESLALQGLFNRENEKIDALGMSPSPALGQGTLNLRHNRSWRTTGGLALAGSLAVLAWFMGDRTPRPTPLVVQTPPPLAMEGDPAATWLTMSKTSALREQREQSAARRTEVLLNNLF